MKVAELWIYGVLLVIAGVLAHGAWKGEEVVAKDSVVLFDPGGAGLQTVTWEGKRNAATLEVSGKGDDVEVWVTAGRKKRLPTVKPVLADDDSADDDDSAAADETPEEPTPAPAPEYGDAELSSFPGSGQAEGLVERFSPLTALRQFDGVSDEDLDGMGLLEPEGTLLLVAGSKTLTLQIGDKAYGSSDTYAREDGAATAYLLSSKDLGPLRSASSSLRDRDMLGFEPTDAVEATIQAPNQAPVPAAHQGRHDKDNSFWTAPDATEERDAVLDGFMKAVLQLKAATYLSAEEMPEASGLEPVVTVVFRGERADLGQLELAREVDEERSKEDDVVYQYYARSHRLRGGWAKVSRTSAEEVSDALAGVLSR